MKITFLKQIYEKQIYSGFFVIYNNPHLHNSITETLDMRSVIENSNLYKKKSEHIFFSYAFILPEMLN